MRSHFDEQLAQLSRELTEMGALCEEVIALSAKALADGDKALAARVDCECANSALLREMAKDTIKMVTESVDAYVRRDTELAKLVIAEDDIVDDYFAKVKKELIAQIAENPAGGEQTLDFLMIAKYFERIGDHAVNIAEWVIFSVTGVHKNSEIP